VCRHVGAWRHATRFSTVSRSQAVYLQNKDVKIVGAKAQLLKLIEVDAMSMMLMMLESWALKSQERKRYSITMSWHAVIECPCCSKDVKFVIENTTTPQSSRRKRIYHDIKYGLDQRGI
jgi:hypothetical protein